MITLEQARQLLVPHGCTVVPTRTDNYIHVWNMHYIDEVLECSLEAINDYIHSSEV